MSNTEELHASIAKMQGLMKQAADRIEETNNALAKSHTHDGIIKDREVLAIVESDADLVAHLRAAALPLDQRHKPTCWKCGDSDPAFTDICQVPACGMKEQA